MSGAAASNLSEFTVSELSFAIKRTMEDAFGLVRLRGEISGYRGPHSSGHAYLCLKDEKARIDGVIWKATLAQMKIKPEEGLEVVVTGRITTFPGKSSYQIVIEQLEPAGAGALMVLLEERKKRLAAEGLFEQARKKPLPFWPRCVGIVTSPTGAVIRDMLHGFTERCPVHVMVWPARVQGETSGDEVARGVRGLNALPLAGHGPLRPDLIIVARGGGSLEDLWGFNDEAVVRAIAESTVPVISAVGHETDWTLADLVADARAPTPTKAAEWAVPKFTDLGLRVADAALRSQRCVTRKLDNARTEFRAAERGLPRPHLLLAGVRQRLDAAETRLQHASALLTRQARGRFDNTKVRLAPHLLVNRVRSCGDRLDRLADRQNAAFAARFAQARSRFEQTGVRLSPALLRNPLAFKAARFRDTGPRLGSAFTRLIDARRSALAARSELLVSVSYRRVLERGFAAITNRDGELITRRGTIQPSDTRLHVVFADGSVPVYVAHGAFGANTASIRPRAKSRLSANTESGQGSLL